MGVLLLSNDFIRVSEDFAGLYWFKWLLGSLILRGVCEYWSILNCHDRYGSSTNQNSRLEVLVTSTDLSRRLRGTLAGSLPVGVSELIISNMIWIFIEYTSSPSLVALLTNINWGIPSVMWSFLDAYSGYMQVFTTCDH